MKHDYNDEVAADTIATTNIGFVQAHEFGGSSFIDKVVVEQTTNADAEWNILADGSSIFASTQSVAASDAPETFVPDQNRNIAGPSAQLEMDVTASAAAADTLNVGVLIDDNKD